MTLFLTRIKGLYAFKDLLKQLVIRDLKIKYRRSFLGYVWSVLNPLLIMLVMVAVFSKMFGNGGIDNFPVYLLTGQTMFNFMNIATINGMYSITGNGSLLKKTYVPKYIFTLAKVTSALVDYFFSLGALIIVMIITGAKFSLTLFAFPIVLNELFIFCFGLGMFLAQGCVFFRDLQYIYTVITTAWMYLTPIFYSMESLPKGMQEGIKLLNPMYVYITQFRYLVLEGTLPDTLLIIKGFVIAFLFLLIGIGSFLRSQDKFILYI